ncbi:MAG: T9SS type A sorting domain-containing protein [Ignavibacteriaceae bacterium]
MGLSNWGGWNTDPNTFSGNRTLQPVFGQPGMYSTTLTFYGPVGDSTAWKVKAYPDANFGNIDPSKISFVGLKGGIKPIGNWAGNWDVSDTVDGPTYADTISTLKVMHKVSANVWSLTQKFPAGTPGGTFEFKFGCEYPGADTGNGGSHPLDNENATGLNHKWLLQDVSTPVVLNYIFGTVDSVAQLPTGIKQSGSNIPMKFELSQNYPNPFNPSTIIKYSVPKGQLVTLKVYNMLGQEVATLVNNQQNAGNYEVTFNADRLASGIYFYTLNAGSFVSTKKMILLK